MSATDHPCRPRTAWLAIVLALAALPAMAIGQTADIGEADIARVRREQRTVTDADIARARQRHALPADPAPAYAPRSPDLDALPAPQATEPLDLAAVAEGFHPTAPPPSLAADHGPALLVFVSLSMPEPALRRLIAQAAQARAPVLIRGLADGSLRQTAARLQALIGQTSASIQIDPRPFEQYGIRQVPAFVLTKAVPSACSEATCTSTDAFVRTSGDVSLDYALAYVQRTAPTWSPAAAIYLQRLER